MLTTFVIGIIGLWLTSDPLTELYSDNGLLNQGRNLGFSVAQAATNNGADRRRWHPAASSPPHRSARRRPDPRPLQMWNFGDHGRRHRQLRPRLVGSAITEPVARDAPAHAMAKTAAAPPKRFPTPSSIDGSIFALGVRLLACWVCSSPSSSATSPTATSWSCGAAFINAIMALFAAGPAMINGRPRRRAARRLASSSATPCWCSSTSLYISFAAVILLKMAAPGGYGAQVGMTHPVALLVLVALMSVVATGLFWWLKKELGDHTRQDLTHAVTSLVHHVRSGYDRGRAALSVAATSTTAADSDSAATTRTATTPTTATHSPASRLRVAPAAGVPAAASARAPPSPHQRPPNANRAALAPLPAPQPVDPPLVPAPVGRPQEPVPRLPQPKPAPRSWPPKSSPESL